MSRKSWLNLKLVVYGLGVVVTLYFFVSMVYDLFSGGYLYSNAGAVRIDMMVEDYCISHFSDSVSSEVPMRCFQYFK